MLRRIFSPVSSASVAILTASFLIVGLAWVTSSASDEGVDTSIPADSTSPPDSTADTTPVNPSMTPDEMAARIVELTTRVADLNETIADLSSSLEESFKKITVLSDQVDDAVSRVRTFTGKTSQLNDDGTYTGIIGPPQISPRLAPADLRGDWPLDRTEGSLGTSKLAPDGWGCTSDSRYVIALVVGAFRDIECARLAR